MSGEMTSSRVRARKKRHLSPTRRRWQADAVSLSPAHPHTSTGSYGFAPQKRDTTMHRCELARPSLPRLSSSLLSLSLSLRASLSAGLSTWTSRAQAAPYHLGLGAGPTMSTQSLPREVTWDAHNTSSPLPPPSRCGWTLASIAIDANAPLSRQVRQGLVVQGVLT
mmetsp:Transcript_12341/g.26451  ORF Transcript_12341/g.26451 Transcript_12341/m.26451 type:complete len:166 (-) Transcript_12341:135-632(-)